MKLKFIKVEETGRNAKLTVHASGKLGFSSDAADYLNINENMSILFAINEADESDKNLYAKVFSSEEEGAFKISKAGDYYYVNAKALLDNIGVDYKNNKIIYDITKGEYEGEEILKLIRREVKRTRKENDDIN